MSIAVAVAAGRAWFGRRVAGGVVVYIVGEGGHAMASRRLRAAAQALGVKADDLPLYITEGAVNLSTFDGVQAQELLAQALSIAAAVGPIALLIVDTVSRCAPGDENSQETMQRLVATLDDIRERLRCDVLGVHHSGIAGTRPRGSTVLEYAADVNLEIRRRPNTNEAGIYPAEIYAHKRREAEDHLLVETFDATRVEVVDDDGIPELDESGRPRTTLVLKNGRNVENEAESRQPHETPTRRSPAKHKALGALLTLGPTFSRISGLEAVRSATSKTSAYRHFSDLTEPVGEDLYRIKDSER
jgi:hypothetical protein